MIKHIRIQNYKSLGDVSVDLDPVTVLIGRSGTGKSNFVDAIRFLRDYLRVVDGTLVIDVNWETIKPATADVSVTSYDICFQVEGINGEFRYKLDLAWQKPLGSMSQIPVEEERLSLDDQVLFHQRQGQWVLEPRVLPIPVPGHLAIGRISGITEVSVAYI